jgi:hypothetical protein
MLVGKGLKVFAELSTDECQHYGTLKNAILNAYSVVSEVHRTRFRNATKQQSETFSDFAFSISIHCKRWLEGEKAFDDLPRLIEVIKLEQFIEKLHPELRTWLTDKAPKTLMDAAKFADEYTALRKAYHKPNHNPNFLQKRNQSHFETSKSFSSEVSNPSTNPNAAEPKHVSVGNDKGKTSNKFAHMECNFCHKKGHIRAQCFALKRAESEKQDVMPSMFVKNSHIENEDKHHVNPLFKNHWCEGIITCSNGDKKNVCLLRDSGSLQSLLSRDKITEDEFVETGEYRLIQGLTGRVIRVPIVKVQLQSKYGEGTYLFGLVDTLPDASFHGLIGNDLDPPSELFDETLTVNVVTRSQAKASCQNALETVSDHSTVADGAPATIPSESDVSATDVSSLFQEVTDASLSETIESITSHEELIKRQHEDPKLASLFHLVQSKTTDLDRESLFYLDQGILMRAWRDVESPNVAGTELSQIVVPSSLKTAILQVAHDIPAAAHLGMAKTKQRLERHFYWPTMLQDIKHYVRSCDICQRLGKGGKPPPAPLQNLPIIAEPFQRIAMDIVGPLPICSESGNRFILTVIDHSTHFPEAIPLVTHEAADVAKALVSVFSRYGFPSEILSDCGTEFMSKLMTIFLNEFKIRRIRQALTILPQTDRVSVLMAL